MLRDKTSRCGAGNVTSAWLSSQPTTIFTVSKKDYSSQPPYTVTQVSVRFIAASILLHFLKLCLGSYFSVNLFSFVLRWWLGFVGNMLVSIDEVTLL